MVRLKTQKKTVSFAKGLEANEILTQGFGSFKLFVVDGCWLVTLCQWLLDVFKCDSPIGFHKQARTWLMFARRGIKLASPRFQLILHFIFWSYPCCFLALQFFLQKLAILLKIGLQNQILATIDQPMRISFLALWDIVYLKILQRRIKWTKYIKPTSLSLFWPISKVPCQYTPHSYDTNVQSLLPSKYMFWKFFCLCSHAPWSKTDESLETINVLTCVWLQG